MKKIKPKFNNALARLVALAIIPGILVSALIYAADMYYDIDTSKIMVNEDQDYTGDLTVTGALTAVGTALVNTTGTAATTIGNGTGTLGLVGGASSTINFTNFDVAGTGNITTQGGYGLDTNAAGVLKLGDVTATTVDIGTTAATTLNMGATGSLARAINIGTGTGVDTIKIGTGGTGADDIDIGDSAAAVDITSGNWSITSAGALQLLTSGSGTSVNEFSTDTGMTGDSDDAVPTEKAVKAYVDAQIGSGGDKIIEDNTSVEVIDVGDGYIVFTEDATEYMRLTGGNLGIGVDDPDTKLEVYNAGDQLKLSFDGTDNTTFAVDTNGDLTITPSGGGVTIAGGGTIDADGVDLLTGNDYQINNVSVLNATTLGTNVLTSSLTTVGALNAGSITSGFGTIDTGSSTITTTGDITGGGIHVTGDTAAGDGAALGYTATEGLILTGQGSTNDMTFKNDADATFMHLLTGTTELVFDAFPITPSADPDADYEVANKKYVDDHVGPSSQLILREMIPIFGWDMPAQTSSDAAYVTVSREIEDFNFPSALSGTTRRYRFIIRYADSVTTTNSDWQVYNTTDPAVHDSFTVPCSASTSLDKGEAYTTGNVTIPIDTDDWRLEVQAEASSTIRIYQIFLAAYDEVN